MKKIFGTIAIIVMIGMFSCVFAKEENNKSVGTKYLSSVKQQPIKQKPLVETQNFVSQQVKQEEKQAKQTEKQTEKQIKQQQKIQQLSVTINQIIPLAEKIKYPTIKLKIYQQQLLQYTTGDIKQITKNIKIEIKNLKIFSQKLRLKK